MKCPSCDFTEKDEAFGDPAICPECGIEYGKAFRARQMRDQLVAQRSGKQPVDTMVEEEPRGRLANAATAVAKGRAARAAREADRAQKIESQKVVVADIDMPFWSMVNFMVKWAIAAIPAMIILMMFFWMLVTVFRSL